MNIGFQKSFKNIYITIAVGVFSLLLAACSNPSGSSTAGQQFGQSINVPGGEYTDISAEELESMLDEKDFIFVNVHIPFAGDIPQTDLSIPFDQIEANIDLLPKEKDAKIILYCRSGSMSSIFAKTLVNLGYSNVWNLSGGFNAWQSVGLPMDGQ